MERFSDQGEKDLMRVTRKLKGTWCFSQEPLRVVMPMENEKDLSVEGRELVVVGERRGLQREEEREAVLEGEQGVLGRKVA